MSKKNTKKQTGLKIVRNGEKFICSWSTRETYKKQKMEFVYRANKKTKTKKPDISAGTKKKVVKLDLDDLNNLSFVRLKLKALANKKDWSAWAVKEFEIDDPNRPTVGMELSNLSNVSVFSWGTKWSKTGHKPFDHVHIQTLKDDYMQDNPNSTKAEFDEIPDSSWEDVKRTVGGKQTTEFPASDTKEFTEDSSKFVGDYSYTRVVRARAEGAGGHSNWNYAWHVYARAKAAVNISAVATLNRANNTFECAAEWSSESTPQHPIDEVQPQYAKAKPETGMTAPDDAGWVDIPVQRDTTDMDAVTFSIDGLLAKDQCVFFRVKTFHDNVPTESIPVLATGNGTGDLKDPTGLRIEADDTTHRVRVYATNTSEVEDSFIAIYYIQNNYDAWMPCGIIPFGSSYVDVQCDNWSKNMPYSFGARTVVASWANETGSDNISRVKIFDRKMQSEQFIRLAGVTAPIPPNNVTVDQADPKTILVKWKWEWGDADGAEVSWSDYENAWDSTQEPETHIVKKIRQSQLYITDLEAGIDWYVRVRYFKGEEGEETYSPYSKQEIIRLTTVPTVPQLTLSPTTIAQSGSVEASWVYVASEDDEQQSAQVVEIVDNTEVPLASVTAEQKVTIPAKTDNREWQTGTTHVLAVRVKNTKGQPSPLSNHASVMIADPLEASIENTNLEQETIDTGARVDTGSLVTLNGGDETNVRDVTSLTVSLSPVQAGTPAQGSVYPISGHDEVTVSVSPTTDAEDGQTYTAALGQTVYGGNAEFVRGTGKSTMGMQTITASMISIYDSYDNVEYAMVSKPTDAASRGNTNKYELLSDSYEVSDTYKGGTWNSAENVGYLFYSFASTHWIIGFPSGTTLAEMQTALEGVQICYELATPTDLTFTPQSITLNEGTNNVWSENGDVTIRTVEGYEDVLALKELPLRFSVTGTSPTSVTNVVVKRAENFEKDRPNGDEFRGYKGEVIYSNEYTGAVVDEEITLEDVIAFGGSFDDTAEYSLEATLKDNLGQVYPTNVLGQDADGEDITSFVVDWTKQATEPSGTVVIEDDVAKITPTADSAYNDDYCNIYRLSADKPVLIAERCTFGKTYVDPYPAIGTYGYRIVLYTANGDYTKDKSEHDEYAWEDIPATYESDYQLIDFADRRITLSRNVDLTNTFTKDFQQTKYLGGAIQGDWNKGVGHSAGIASVAVTLIDQDDIDAIRELGWYEGQAHVRTKDGACYTADVQVSDSTGHDKGGLVKSYNFSITRVESQELDGVLLEDWEAE